MLKNKKILIITYSLFIIAEITIGILLQVIPGRTSNLISYAAIVLACLFCLIFAERSKSYFFTQTALLCTVCADFFLVYSLEMKQLPAMLFFSVTQICYFLRLYFEDTNKKRRNWHIICRASLSLAIIIVTAAVLGEKSDAVALVSMFYYANIILNALFAFIFFKKNPIFAIGIFLFVLCDTVVGLSMMNAYLPVSPYSPIYKIIHPGFNLAWAFYVPSQTLLAISLLPKKLK